MSANDNDDLNQADVLMEMMQHMMAAVKNGRFVDSVEPPKVTESSMAQVKVLPVMTHVHNSQLLANVWSEQLDANMVKIVAIVSQCWVDEGKVIESNEDVQQSLGIKLSCCLKDVSTSATQEELPVLLSSVTKACLRPTESIGMMLPLAVEMF